MTISQDRVPIGTGSPTRDVARTPDMLGTSLLVALGIVIATSYAFVPRTPTAPCRPPPSSRPEGKILTLFGALWAGPAYALATDGPVALGPDAAPSLLLLAVSAWLLRRWWSALTPTDGNNEGAAS